MDVLFKPGFAGSLQILKVEIGGDTQSTDGTEASHMHTEHETPNYNRGYEWAVMKAAKARNPNIVLYALPWAWPGWLRGDSNSSTNPLLDNTNVTADYVARWIDGAAKVHGNHK